MPTGLPRFRAPRLAFVVPVKVVDASPVEQFHPCDRKDENGDHQKCYGLPTDPSAFDTSRAPQGKGYYERQIQQEGKYESRPCRYSYYPKWIRVKPSDANNGRHKGKQCNPRDFGFHTIRISRKCCQYPNTNDCYWPQEKESKWIDNEHVPISRLATLG